ncbi:MAG: PaaI family thioesterase [Caulobacteraceae bacterium]|nr:PaaI family thioesterase [Caulobacteraceae bacterium]
MTAVDGTAPAPTTRSRTVAWEAPEVAHAAAAGLSGLAIMRGLRDGTIPAPPIARLIGFEVIKAEPGEIVMQLNPHEGLENPMGLLHGGAAATVLDTAMGAAAHTLAPGGQAVVTLDLTITYLRPLNARSGPIRVTGRVINMGGRTAYVEGDARDGEGKLVAHAVGNFSLIGPRPR